ncbi:hypothetical protein ITJ42_15330 [Clavibacter michiganensis subsp. phaseoli]|uniref:Uncharacterized protein n=1 Tax=Clavibacter phaseoli TaxID=1734031 RepID=A0A8I0SD47_9MICO|nr:hypothetical protein [Clavibacter phaseoli]MBF4632591.1 hypothetical protein [Clavibacter phaseoli]
MKTLPSDVLQAVDVRVQPDGLEVIFHSNVPQPLIASGHTVEYGISLSGADRMIRRDFIVEMTVDTTRIAIEDPMTATDAEVNASHVTIAPSSVTAFFPDEQLVPYIDSLTAFSVIDGTDVDVMFDVTFPKRL